MRAPVIQHLKKRLPALLLGSALGLGVGWLLRGVAGSAPAASAQSASTPEQETSTGAHSAHSRAEKAALVAVEDAAVQSFLRLACTADAAALNELPRHLLAAQKFPGVLPFLAAHWAQRGSPHLFAALREGAPAQALAGESVVRKALFDHWLKSDPDAALAALGDNKALPEMDSLRSAAVRDLLHKEPRRALGLIGEWQLNLRYNDMGGISEWAKREPSAAADASAQVPLPMVSEHLVIEVARVWKDTDPAAAIQWAVNHASQFPGSNASATMAHVVRMDEDGYDPAKANAAADTITDHAMRIHLGLPPLPPADARAVAPHQ